MLMYVITLVSLPEEISITNPTLLSQLYADDAAFDGSKMRSAAQLRLLMDQGPERGYFPEPAKSLFIA